MITFYADSVKDAYEKMKNDEWKGNIREYIIELGGVVDGMPVDTRNILSLFELDAYDIYITWQDVTYQTSRLAMAFRKYILGQYDNKNKVSRTLLLSPTNEAFLNNSFKSNLKKLRKKNDITQKELSIISKIPLNTIINYENEQRTPTGKNLCRLAIALKVSPLELLGTDID